MATLSRTFFDCPQAAMSIDFRENVHKHVHSSRSRKELRGPALQANDPSCIAVTSNFSNATADTTMLGLEGWPKEDEVRELDVGVQ